MSVDIRDKAAVEKRLWEELDKGRFGMLGVLKEGVGHFVPMTAFSEPESGKIWFFTDRDTDLARAAEAAGPAAFIVIGKDQDLQACFRGTLRTDMDAIHRDKYWSPMVSAWFPKGKDDPTLTMLCLTCEDADVWLSEAGPVKFGWEITKANLTGSTPDIGGRAHVTFP